MLRPLLSITLLTLLVTGLLYPLAGTGIAQLAFPHQANGSLVRDAQDRVLGSTLIGQLFTTPGYFHGRPSAAGAGYDPTASGGSNLGPTSQNLKARVDAERARLGADAPTELLAASGSGLDPHVSPEAARWQADRVARARGVTVDRVQAIVDEQIEERELGVLGEPRVNVLMLNRALDARLGTPP